MYEYRKLKYRKYGMYGCTGHVAHFDYLFGIDRYSQWLYGKICIKNFHIYIYIYIHQMFRWMTGQYYKMVSK